MRWYEKEISLKTSWISFLVIMGIVLMVIYVQYREDSKKLSNCSVYTIGTINRVFTVRGQPRIAYKYGVVRFSGTLNLQV